MICHYCNTPIEGEPVFVMGEPMCENCVKVYNE